MAAQGPTKQDTSIFPIAHRILDIDSYYKFDHNYICVVIPSRFGSEGSALATVWSRFFLHCSVLSCPWVISLRTSNSGMDTTSLHWECHKVPSTCYFHKLHRPAILWFGTRLYQSPRYVHPHIHFSHGFVKIQSDILHEQKRQYTMESMLEKTYTS